MAVDSVTNTPVPPPAPPADTPPPPPPADVEAFEKASQEALASANTGQAAPAAASQDTTDRTEPPPPPKEATDANIDAEREKAGLPPLKDSDIANLPTTEKDPDDASKSLTVGQSTWKNLSADWKKGIEDGSIKSDDDRAKLYEALRGKGMLENGVNMVTLDIQSGLNTAKVTSGDVDNIIDGAKLDKQIGDLFSSESVQKDFQSKQTEAIGKLENKDAVQSKLEDMAFGEDYARYIGDLKAGNQDDIAKADIGRTYAALNAFDPEKAGDFAQSITVSSLTTDLNNAMKNPDGISEENTALATQDTVKTVLAALKKTADIPRRTIETLEKFTDEYLNKDGTTAKNFGKSLQELGDLFRKNGDSLSNAEIEKVFNKDIYKTVGEGARGQMLAVASELNGNGTLGSVGGLISLASGLYQTVGKGGTLADTPEERLAIAKDFVSVLGAGQHFVNLGTNIIDTVNGSKLNEMMGLSKTLPEIFGTDKAQAGAKMTPEAVKKVFDNFNDTVDAAPTASRDALAKKLNMSPDDWKTFIKGYEEGFAKNPGLTGSTPGTRAVSSFLRIMDAGANTFGGVADIVLGGLKVKSGAASGDPSAIANGAISVAGGAFTLAGGASQGAALLGSTIGRALAGPLLGVGAGLSLLALTPFLIYEDIKRTNQINDYEKNQQDLIGQLDKLGVLEGDGVQRYEFLSDYMRNYGQRDAPDDTSIFDYRRAEYDFWVKEGHLPEPGWDDLKHDDYAGDGDNLTTQMDNV